MIKVLIVDDSAFMRSTINRMLSAHQEIEVVGQAKNGKEGLEFAKKLRPDIITLDIEMPVMNGLDMLKELMQTMPTPVLMVSSLTTEGAEATFKALDLGALDFIPKYTDDSFSTKKLQEELCEKVLHVSRRARYMRHKFAEEKKNTLRSNSLNRTNTQSIQTSTQKTSLQGANQSSFQANSASAKTSFTSTSSSIEKTTSSFSSTNAKASTEPKKLFTKESIETKSSTQNGEQALSLPMQRAKRSIIGIGVSTGGPPAIQEVLSKLPQNLPAAILIAQHMPASFTNPFAQRLDKLSELRVKEAEDGEQVQNGTVYIAPGGLHMSVQQKGALPFIKISPEPPTEIYKPSANVLFDSLSQYGAKALGIIMTGMGSDGCIGLKTFKEKKGFIIAQNEETCVVYGMPKAVIEEGIADQIKSLAEIPQALINALYS